MVQKSLICTRCGKTYQTSRTNPRCDTCNEPLEVENATRGKIKEKSGVRHTIMERYADFLPLEKIDLSASLYEGFTPLLAAEELAAEVGVRNLYLKNETENPTWSFKDRGTAVGVQHALSLGYKKIGTLSTGNMAASMAAYGARAGLKTFILVSTTIADEKLNPIAIYGVNLIRVDEDYGKLYFDSLEIGSKYGVYFISSDVPFRVEGTKTVSFEICEQLNFQTPDYVIFPTSSGGGVRGIIKGFEEFKLCGLIDRMPTIVAAQATGAAAIYNAYVSNAAEVSRIDNPQTIAHAIRNNYPPSGNQVLRKMREMNGMVTAVTDEEILAAQKQMAKTGVFGQPAAAAPLAAAKRLKKEGVIKEGDSVVCIVTGSGLKHTGVLESQELKVSNVNLDGLIKIIR